MQRKNVTKQSNVIKLSNKVTSRESNVTKFSFSFARGVCVSRLQDTVAEQKLQWIRSLQNWLKIRILFIGEPFNKNSCRRIGERNILIPLLTLSTDDGMDIYSSHLNIRPPRLKHGALWLGRLR